jgi:O-acetylserine/cysteine efflux transporter
MNTNRRHALAALCVAGLLWGTTVPLSKLALEWLPGGWLAATRFGLAAAILLAVGKRGLRAAFTPRILASGAIGYGGSVIVQNMGITRTSVTHAALLIGASPVLVAIIAAVWHRTVARPAAWAGFALSLAGVGLVTSGGGGGGATLRGDALVLASLLISTTFTVGQARLLPGRDPVAVTAVQFLGAAFGALAFTLITEGVPRTPASPGPVLAVAALTACGTVLPFTLFAYGQSRVSSEVAGAFLNLEPLVGAVAGAAFFGDPAGAGLLLGGAAILAGIGLSTFTLFRSGGGAAAGRAEGRAGAGRPGSGTRKAGVTAGDWGWPRDGLGDGGLVPAGVVRLRTADVFRPPDIRTPRRTIGAARGWNQGSFGIFEMVGEGPMAALAGRPGVAWR